MNRRVAIAGLLALAVLLAGCQFGATGTETADPLATDTETTPTATPDPFGGVAHPPGVDESGVTDVDGLLEAHAAALADASVTVDTRFHLTVDGSGQNVSLRGETVPDGVRGWMEIELRDGVGTYYTEDGTTYYREVVDESVTYGTTGAVSAVPERPRFGSDERIETAVESAEWEPVGSVERDGRTLVEFRATSVDPPDVNTTGDATVSSDGRLLVAPDGVVHHVDVSTTVENENGTVRYGTSVSLSGVGSTTVERPDWYDQAEGT